MLRTLFGSGSVTGRRALYTALLLTLPLSFALLAARPAPIGAGAPSQVSPQNPPYRTDFSGARPMTPSVAASRKDVIDPPHRTDFSGARPMTPFVAGPRKDVINPPFRTDFLGLRPMTPPRK